EGASLAQFAWQVGLTYHITTNLYATVAPVFYLYSGLHTGTPSGFGGPYVGEGAFLGPGTGTTNGSSGFVSGSAGNATGFSNGYPNNQSGLNDLQVLEVPFELNYKLCDHLNLRLFGDFAYNFGGGQRAEEAASAYAAYLTAHNATISPFSPQRN